MEGNISFNQSLRLATKTDLLVGKGLLKIGQPIYVKHFKDNKIYGVYIIDAFTRAKKLEEYFNHDRIFVPDLEYINDINNQLLQHDYRSRLQNL
ncbi:hypothetical protein [Lacinutrix sp. Hel_I_90]|uniref:hypothetical protein n=1 Tax=Lacinutrix sp. Hel_I_90 TaxID=1249999 RepID=UPI0005C92F58|nr:hypothetical protein [Lacinutrix sp. Hel_I_90]